MSKKLHAKDLKKKDEFIETLGDLWGPAFHWLQVNRNLVVGSVGGALLIALLVGAVGSLRQSKAEDAQAALGEALDSLGKAEAAAADPTVTGPSWEEVRADFAAVAEEHGGAVAAIAKHYVGVAQLRAGDAAGAVATLKEAADATSGTWEVGLTLSVLAAAQERAGDVAGAEATLKRLCEGDTPGYPADAATMDLARFFERQGRLDEARGLYAELAPDPDSTDEARALSPYAGQAQARLNELEG